MEPTIRSNSQAREYIHYLRLARGSAWGLVGGLTGTLVMDLMLMGALSAAGLPALMCFSIVGSTAMSFFSNLGIEIAGGVLLGVVVHYSIGPIVGALFGAVVAVISAHRVVTPKKCVVLSVLYVEILSQPILAATPLLLKMTSAETIQWFSAAFVMHFLLGVVLGAVISRGLELAVKQK